MVHQQAARDLGFLGLLCSPTLALRIGNPLARLRAQHATLLRLCGGGRLRDLLGYGLSYLDGDFAGASQQRASLSEACDFGVDKCKNGINSHKSRIIRNPVLHNPAIH
jgi:hypothetical protein